MATGGDDKNLREAGKYFGLKCFGKTSWCNSIVQALYFCEPFRVNLLEYYDKKRKKEGADGERTLLSALADLFALVSSQENQTGVIDTQSFMDVVRDEYHIVGDYTQQDAHEFLLKLLNEVAKTLEKDSTTIGFKGFQGFNMTSTVSCVRCESVDKETDQPILTVNLKVKPHRSLTALFREFYSPEILKKLRHCTHCNSDQEVQISVVIKEEPRILIFHLLRFKEYGTDELEKLELPFSQELRLFHTKDNDGPLYSLTAIVFHLGKNFDSGHYVCVIKSDNRWLLFDQDKDVKMIDESALQSSFDSEHGTCTSFEDVYILFYERTTDTV